VCNPRTGEWQPSIVQPYDSGQDSPCTIPGVLLALYNGESLHEATGVNQTLCEDLCWEREDCQAWTHHNSEDWCALKRWDQVLEEENEEYASGYKNC